MANKRVVQLIVGGRVHEDGSVRSMRLRRSHRWLSRRWRWLELPGPRAQAGGVRRQHVLWPNDNGRAQLDGSGSFT